ncbi:MAG TPA: hypothetical protein VGP50_05390 [Stellaceae bacterium]|jgi:hypothetical protein|nr:hypothetical protein [Stellaceae bacterium]
MGSVLLVAMLSLMFFSGVLTAEMKDGDGRRIRELGVILGILMVVAAYASHAIIAASWPQIASLSSLILRGS